MKRLQSFIRTPLLRAAGLLLAAASLVLPFVSSGCSKGEAPAAENQVPEVGTVTPQVMDLTRDIDQPGHLVPYYDNAIYTKIAGFAEEPKVDIGFWVKKGQLLLKLRVPEVAQDLIVKEARVQQAEADLKQYIEAANAAKAGMESAKADINAKEAVIRSAQASVERWKAEHERAVRLVTAGTFDTQTRDEILKQLETSRATVDEASAKKISADANYRQAAAQYEKTRADIEVAKANVQVAKETYLQWKDWLSYAEIRAPMDGVITERNVNTGDFLQPANSGTTSKASKPVFTLMNTDIMRMTVQVPEIDAALINSGDLKDYGFRLLAPMQDANQMPKAGKKEIVVAEVNQILHFRVFDADGNAIVDTDESKLKDAKAIKDLRKLLEYDILWMAPLTSTLDIPRDGNSLIVVVDVQPEGAAPSEHVLHFRIFDADGNVVVDTDESRLPKKAALIEALRTHYPDKATQHQFTTTDKKRGIEEVIAIVGHGRQLRGMWPPHVLQPSESGQICAAVKALVARPTVGDVATIRFQALPGTSVDGTVCRASEALDTHSRTLTIEIHLDNHERKLKPGMYANVRIKAKLRNARTLPADSILSDILADGDRSYCYVVENGKLVKTFLEVGARCEEGVQVLRKQRQGGPWEEFTGKEAVVVEPPMVEGKQSKQVGPKALSDGQAVKVITQ